MAKQGLYFQRYPLPKEVIETDAAVTFAKEFASMPCFSHTQLPYCLQKTTDGKWLALNRRYKPVGTTNLDWVDYNTHPDRLDIDEGAINEIKDLSPCVHPDMPNEPGIIYLFAGDPTPLTSDLDWVRYTKLLKLVAAASTDK